MKITEITQLRGQRLYESLDSGNDTGVATSDLVRVVEAHRADVWSEPVDIDSYIKNLREGTLAWQKGAAK